MSAARVSPPRVRFRTKRELAYGAIREAILSGRLKPGDRLVINRLARDLDLSDVPVREAMVQLESEGLLATEPHVGATVAAMDPDDVLDVYLIGSVLEGAAARWATPELTDKDLTRLAEQLDAMDASVADGDLDAFARQDREFHRLIVRRCPSARLVQLIEDLWSTKEQLRTAYPVRARGAATQEENRVILDALKRRDAEAAERLMREHLEAAGRNRAQALEADATE